MFVANILKKIVGASHYLPPEGGGGREIEKGDYHGFQGNGGNQSMLRKGRGGSLENCLPKREGGGEILQSLDKFYRNATK